MPNQLEALSRHTVIVADTGDIQEIAEQKPQDATTNPSLIKKAAGMPEYADLVEAALQYAGKRSGGEVQQTEAFLDHLFVGFGKRILEIIPGRVSTEVDARLSFDTQATVDKARALVGLYEEAGIGRERVLIKIASTWEGIRASEVLEREGIHCNMTLLFCLAQAVACAEAKATLISPFVGRIYDWYKRDQGVDEIPLEQDPGVASVRGIYEYFKRFGYATEVMGASFRRVGQITELCGCDLLTISPDLLDELRSQEGDLPRLLDPEAAKAASVDRIQVDEANFRWHLNEDAMATEKLADGIRRFYKDGRALATFAMERVAGGA